jgi:hypothetical protein
LWLPANVAVTVFAPSTVTVQLVPFAVSQPDQLPKVEPGLATAVSATCAPLLNDAEQAFPQLMPAGLLVTVPEPAPVFVTVSV